MQPFHLAIPVRDLDATRAFYRDVMGCPEGRSSERWVDFDLYGHQLVIHLVSGAADDPERNPVDGERVPVPHFGVVLERADWNALAERLTARKVTFDIEPTVRFVGEKAEQATMFFRDPSGNALEFKSFTDPAQLFAVDGHGGRS